MTKSKAPPYLPQLRLYQNWLRETRGLSLDSYDALWRWSTTAIRARTGKASGTTSTCSHPPPTAWCVTLRRQVASLALHLQAQGVQPGDRVAAYLPNIPEAMAAF